MILVSASIIAYDLLELGGILKTLEESGVDLLHIDVMDGNFVPNITVGPDFVRSLKNKSKIPLDVHLLVVNPERFVEMFYEAGADYLTVHVEATQNPKKLLKKIKDLNIKPGISLNPETEIQKIIDTLELVDIVLVMSVNPGFSRQRFLPSAIDKIKALNELRREKNLGFLISVDGGVNWENAGILKRLGVDILVSGGFIFDGDIRERVNLLKYS